MEEFTIRIAGIHIEVVSRYPYARNCCREFMRDGKPDLHVAITQEDILREREACEALGFSRVPGDGYLETMALFRKLTEMMPDRGVFLLHGAAVSLNECGIIFSGFSGVGKTTHIKKWILNLPDLAVINGDKPFIAAGKPPLVYGSPWGGKEQLFTNASSPLKHIVLMERAEENRIDKIPLSEAFPRLCQQIARPDDAAITAKTLHLLRSLDPAVSFWRFGCNNFRDDCFDVAYGALIGNGQ